MKLVYKRSSGATASAVAIAEPEESLAPPPALPEPLPAPAGALHRASAPGPSPALSHQVAEAEEYVPQRGSYGARLRGGMPRGLAGRLLLASGTLLALAVVILTMAAIRQFLLHDPRFTITTSTEIAVEGNEHISRADVLGVFGSDLERNIFKIPLAERREDLQRLPWVGHATVERLLPNHLRVHLTERLPIAFVRQGSHIGLVDAEGVLLDMPPDSAGDPGYSFPVLTGLAPEDTPELRAARMEVYRRFVADLDSRGQRRTGSLSEVDVTNPEDVKALVTLDGADILVHFGDESFLRRFQAFQQHLPEWRQQYPRLASADMRYEREVVLEMQGGAPPPIGEAALSGNTATPPHAPAPSGRPAAPGALPHRASPAPRRAIAGRSAANDRLFHALAAARAGQAGTRTAASRSTGRR